MRQNLVIGNWKMHGSRSGNEQLLAGLLELLPSSLSNSVVAVCPPALYIDAVKAQIADSVIQLGAQNICAESVDQGAYTGEVSAKMLAEFDCKYVLVGHSERREYYVESDAVVANKFKQAQAQGLTPVLCIGESLEQREGGDYIAVLTAQLKAVIDAVGIAAFNYAVVAYEPIWAIGTGKTASAEQAQDVHAAIRDLFSEHDAAIAEQLQVLYGGSVKAANAAELFAMEDIDGALVGGASLKAEEFSAICNAAE
ncbi:MAG: triose-phosphate isomerase [Pseudomonadales bacterium]|nr:triose-phosphate isomerase [Pseudomonadales bacterium]